MNLYKNTNRNKWVKQFIVCSKYEKIGNQIILYCVDWMEKSRNDSSNTFSYWVSCSFPSDSFLEWIISESIQKCQCLQSPSINMLLFRFLLFIFPRLFLFRRVSYLTVGNISNLFNNWFTIFYLIFRYFPNESEIQSIKSYHFSFHFPWTLVSVTDLVLPFISVFVSFLSFFSTYDFWLDNWFVYFSEKWWRGYQFSWSFLQSSFHLFSDKISSKSIKQWWMIKQEELKRLQLILNFSEKVCVRIPLGNILIMKYHSITQFCRYFRNHIMPVWNALHASTLINVTYHPFGLAECRRNDGVIRYGKSFFLSSGSEMNFRSILQLLLNDMNFANKISVCISSLWSLFPDVLVNTDLPNVNWICFKRVLSVHLNFHNFICQ